MHNEHFLNGHKRKTGIWELELQGWVKGYDLYVFCFWLCFLWSTQIEHIVNVLQPLKFIPFSEGHFLQSPKVKTESQSLE